MEAIYSSEIYVEVHRTTQHYIQEGIALLGS
jgi:hypothetical protein